MRIFYKKHYTERGYVDIDKDYINSEYGGDIVGAVKEKAGRWDDSDKVKFEILDYDLDEDEMNYKRSAEYMEDVYEQIDRDQWDAVNLIYDGLKDLRDKRGEVRF